MQTGVTSDNFLYYIRLLLSVCVLLVTQAFLRNANNDLHLAYYQTFLPVCKWACGQESLSDCILIV
jgi:hypothetical protein